MTSNLRSKPPSHLGGKDFIDGADQRTAELRSKMQRRRRRTRESKPRRMQRKLAPSAPWEDPQVRDDVLKVYNLRLPEPYLLKLKHIAAAHARRHAPVLD